MTDLGSYPDARAAVGDLVSDLVTAVYLGSVTLSSIQAGALPAVRIVRTGGSDDGFTDTSVLRVAWFAGSADAAWTTAEACHQRLLSSVLLSSASQGTAAGLVDHLAANDAPQLASAPDVTVTQVVTATYTVQMRRTAQ